MTAAPKRRTPPAAKLLPGQPTRPTYTFVVYERADAESGDPAYALGEIESTDSTTAEFLYAQREGMTARERRDLVAWKKKTSDATPPSCARLAEPGECDEELTDSDRALDAAGRAWSDQ